jgi:hypothetical protein
VCRPEVGSRTGVEGGANRLASRSRQLEGGCGARLAWANRRRGFCLKTGVSTRTHLSQRHRIAFFSCGTNSLSGFGRWQGSRRRHMVPRRAVPRQAMVASTGSILWTPGEGRANWIAFGLNAVARARPLKSAGLDTQGGHNGHVRIDLAVEDPWACPESVLPYNLPYKSRQLPSSGVVARLQHPWSDRFTPSGAVQKNPLGRIISSLEGRKLEDLRRRGVLGHPQSFGSAEPR